MRNVGLIWLRASPRLKLIRTLLSAALSGPAGAGIVPRQR